MQAEPKTLLSDLAVMHELLSLDFLKVLMCSEGIHACLCSLKMEFKDVCTLIAADHSGFHLSSFILLLLCELKSELLGPRIRFFFSPCL